MQVSHAIKTSFEASELPVHTFSFHLQTFTSFVLFLQSKGKKPVFIVKPDEGSQGDGIYLITEPKEYVMGSKRHVVQEYLSDPYLLEDLKFDFRIYVLISNLEPLEVRGTRVGGVGWVVCISHARNTGLCLRFVHKGHQMRWSCTSS